MAVWDARRNVVQHLLYARSNRLSSKKVRGILWYCVAPPGMIARTLPILQRGFFLPVVMIDCTLLSGLVLAPMPFPCDSAQTTWVQEEFMKTAPKKPRAKADFEKDRRRKHHHYLVTVYYEDGEKFGRVYTDKDKASRFAERQRRSPVVKAARVSQVS
jgi:hypothetical protein